MQHSLTFHSFFYKNGYLLVLAAWLITISFMVDNYWSANASINTVKKEISNYVNSQERSFIDLVNDTTVINKISKANLSEAFLLSLIKKKYFLFFYTPDSSSNERLICWNTQQVLPYPSLLYENRSKGFVQLENGFYVWTRYNIGHVKAIALIPVKWNYIVSNDYLENNFVVDESFAFNYDVT